MRHGACCLVVAILVLLGTGHALAADYTVAGIDDPALVTRCLTGLRQAVANDDRQAVAALVRFPIKVIVEGRRRSIPDKAAFVAWYATIMNQNVRTALLSQQDEQLFVNYQGVMLGNGQIWLGLVAGVVKVIAINN